MASCSLAARDGNPTSPQVEPIPPGVAELAARGAGNRPLPGVGTSRSEQVPRGCPPPARPGGGGGGGGGTTRSAGEAGGGTRQRHIQNRPPGAAVGRGLRFGPRDPARQLRSERGPVVDRHEPAVPLEP